MTDGRAGLTAADIDVAQSLRVDGKLVYCVVNKIDGVDPNVACSDFYQLGFSDIFPIAAAHGRGVNQLIEAILETYPDLDSSTEAQQAGIKLAVVGRPNVGKSTFVNRILGEQRVIVADEAGTTRDSIFIPLTYARPSVINKIRSASVMACCDCALAISSIAVCASPIPPVSMTI